MRLIYQNKLCLKLLVSVVAILVLTLMPVKGLAASPNQGMMANTVHHPIRVRTSGSPGGLAPLAVRPSISGYSPDQIRKAYGIDLLGGTGTGKTIAIVDAYGSTTIADDLQKFNQQFGLPAVNLTIGPPGVQLGGDGGWALETALDIEWAHAIAPGANLLLVVSRTATLGDLLDAVDYATAHADIVSMSWGGDEYPDEVSYDGHFNHPGKIYLASSGDAGAGVMWPAVSPDVIAVGGTTLTVSGNGTYLSERAWSGSGGGQSQYEPKPDCQKNFQNSNFRTVPDVAFLADPATGVAVYNAGIWSVVGGTSYSAPCWAGLLARGAPRDLTWVYSQASAGKYADNYHDVTTGSNGLAAGIGYDMVTGLGSPKAQNLIPGIASKIAIMAGTQPVTAGTVSPNILVQVQDNYANLTGVSSNITVNLTSSSASGNFSTDNITWDKDISANITPVNSSFGFYYQDTIAGNPVLTAASANLTAASSSITISPAPKNKLIWGTPPPVTVTANATWPSFSIKIADQYGNQTADIDSVTLNASTGSLFGTLSRSAVAGLAAFNDIFSKASGNLTLTGSCVTGNLTPVSAFLNITVPSPAPAPHPAPVSYGGGGGGFSPPPSTPKPLALSGLSTTSGLALDSYSRAQSTAEVKSEDGNLTLDIAKNTVLCEANGVPLKNLTAKVVAAPPSPPPAKSLLLAYELGPEGALFNPAITLSLAYNPRVLPEGTVGESVTLAFWNGSQWVTVDSKIDKEQGKISASISHFSIWGLLATVIPPPKITLGEIQLSQETVKVGESVTLQASLTNSGGSSGKYSATLKINDSLISSQEITLAAGASQTLSFKVSKDTPGSYTLDLNGKTAKFTVLAPPVSVVPLPAPQITTVPLPAVESNIPEMPEVRPIPSTSEPSPTPEKKPAFPILWPLIEAIIVCLAIGGLVIVRQKNHSK